MTDIQRRLTTRIAVMAVGAAMIAYTIVKVVQADGVKGFFAVMDMAILQIAILIIGVVVVIIGLGIPQESGGHNISFLARRRHSRVGNFLYMLSTQWELLLISLPFFVYIFIFSYVPLWGLTMAFQDYWPGRPFTDQPWVGGQHFQALMRDPEFMRVIRNTFAMGGINIVLHFVTAIVFALLLNELIGHRFKRVVQTVSYMPHFLSWIVVTGIAANMLAMDGGVINEVLMRLGIIDQKIHFLGEQRYFWGIVGVTNVWKSMGWNSIIYLAAITSIDPALYEAAAIDGCSRFKRNLYITLPGIKSTIVILFIMNAGWLLNVSFEIPYLLGASGPMLDVSETIDIYVLRKGLARESYSFGTAAGLFKTAVSVVILTLANFGAGLLGEEKLI